MVLIFFVCLICFHFVEKTKFRSTLLPFVATKSNVASTVLLVVWTGPNAAGGRAGWPAAERLGGQAAHTARRASTVTSSYGDTLYRLVLTRGHKSKFCISKICLLLQYYCWMSLELVVDSRITLISLRAYSHWNVKIQMRCNVAWEQSFLSFVLL